MKQSVASRASESVVDSVRVLDPFKDSRQLWLGLEEEGLRRKVFQIITPDTVGSRHLRAGLTIFEPGEQCAPHNHPDSEEFNVAIKGSGLALDITAGTELTFNENDWIFIPAGNVHVHRNNGDEPLWLLWCYAPPGELPKR
jgi:putative monooxygenase